MEGDSYRGSSDEGVSEHSLPRASETRAPTLSILKTPTINFPQPQLSNSPSTNEEEEAEVNCDELIKELVGPIAQPTGPTAASSAGSSKIFTKDSKDSKMEHDSNCPMHDEDATIPKVQSSEDDISCPPGARKWCTCGVCPLDLLEKEEEEKKKEAEKEKEEEKQKEQDENKEKDADKEKEKEVDKEKEKEKEKKKGKETLDTKTKDTRDTKKGKEKVKEKEKEKKKQKETKKDLKDKKDEDRVKDPKDPYREEKDGSSRRDESSSDDYSSETFWEWDGEGWGLEHRKHKYGSTGKEEEGELQDYNGLMSDRSSHEGRFVEDYMRFFIEPMDVCYRSLSSVSSSYISCEETGLQRTIVIVKPQAVKFKEAIYRVIFEEGFQILGMRVLHLTPEQVSEIYSKYYGSPSFVHLVVSVSEAPVLAICISAMNVIKRWLNMIGPDGCLRAEWFYPLSMRKLFGLQDTHADWIHGSENLRESNKENHYFFPKAIVEPLIQELDKVTDYCALTMNKSIVEACTEVVKKRPADPIIFFADYILLHNPFQPRFPRHIAMTPT